MARRRRKSVHLEATSTAKVIVVAVAIVIGLFLLVNYVQELGINGEQGAGGNDPEAEGGVGGGEGSGVTTPPTAFKLCHCNFDAFASTSDFTWKKGKKQKGTVKRGSGIVDPLHLALMFQRATQSVAQEVEPQDFPLSFDWEIKPVGSKVYMQCTYPSATATPSIITYVPKPQYEPACDPNDPEVEEKCKQVCSNANKDLNGYVDQATRKNVNEYFADDYCLQESFLHWEKYENQKEIPGSAVNLPPYTCE